MTSTNTQTRTRDAFPDILRGFALFGIAMVNIQFFSISTFNGAESLDLSIPANGVVAALVWTLFQAKFYLIFSFLFGYSAHYVIGTDRLRRSRWMGRAVGLILLGLVHLTFLFHGDILFLYGVFGLVLTLLYFRSDKTLKIWAWVIYLVTGILLVGLALLTFAGEFFLASKGKSLPPEVGIFTLDSALLSGTFLEVAAARLDLWVQFAGQAFLLQGPMVFAAFLAGLIAARRGALAENANPTLMKRLAVWGLTLGVALQLGAALLLLESASADAYGLGLYLMGIAFNFLTAPLMTAGLIGGLWMISQRLKLGLLGAAGRHSLTIYLSQSVVFSTLFSAWGFGLFQELSLLSVVLIAAFTWLVLALLAQLNLKYRTQGPMERVLTEFSRIFERKS